jgi:hypothetical protein
LERFNIENLLTEKLNFILFPIRKIIIKTINVSSQCYKLPLI